MNDEKMLKPCPFCGSNDLSINVDYGLRPSGNIDDEDDRINFIQCNDRKCPMQRFGWGTKEKLIELWNRRTI